MQIVAVQLRFLVRWALADLGVALQHVNPDWLLSSCLKTSAIQFYDLRDVAVQLRFLVRWGLADVEDASQHAGPFQLLRGVIARQIVIPEVYDVMRNVQDLMVRAQVQLPQTPLVPLGSNRMVFWDWFGSCLGPTS